MSLTDGLIFLSHASEDKSFVEKVYARLDASSVFYDIRSIEPGRLSMDAMEEGVESSAVFVLFLSPHSQKPWIEFEKDTARLTKITKSTLKILVCPLDGETYRALPLWMQRYMTTTPQYRVNDIARAILDLQHQSLIQKGLPKEIFVGREDLCRQVELDVLSAPVQVGSPIQHLLLTGIPGMGRSSVAKAIIASSFPTMRSAGPVFDLPDMADAADIHLRLKEDLDGVMSKEEIEKQISAFQFLSVDDQAALLLKSLSHWADLNQVVVLRTRWGLRDRNRNLKPWLASLFRQSTSVRNLRVLYVSERKLSSESFSAFPAVRQYDVADLSERDIQYILSKKTEARYFDVEAAAAISKKVRGHPATAHHVAFLTNGGMSLDSISLNPEPIYAFQDKILDAIFAGDALDTTQREILTVLGWFPKLPITLLADLIGTADRKQMTDDVWDLKDYSLVHLGEGGYYQVPEVVSAKIRRDPRLDSSALFTRVKAFIEGRMKAGKLDADLIDALLIAAVNVDGSIPQELRKIITSANLLNLVVEQFQVAISLEKSHDAFRRTYNLSKLAFGMQASDDTIEQILFTGGDAAIRAGVYPDDIIKFMSEKALPSVYYLIGSYAFYIEKDYKKAARNLNTSLKLKHFRNRNVRLLAKTYIRDQLFNEAKDVLDLIPDFQLYRDSGLLVLKIRALRGTRNNKEARELEKQLASVSDQFADRSIYLAGRAFQENNFNDAEKYIQAAKESPRGSRLAIAILECAVAIEKGKSELLAETVELAVSAGRQFDAWQLQSRMAIKKRDWKEALELLSKIDRKDIFDLQLERRALQLKKEDPDVARDPVELKEVELKLEANAMASYKTPDSYRDA